MTELTEHFKVCDCHDSWDQCPCAEGGHPLDRECGCCGRGICGDLPTLADRLAAARAEGARDMRTKVETLIVPGECYVLRAPVVRAADPGCRVLIGARFPNARGEWTEGMCCLPCRLRALLADGGEPQ